MGLDQYAYACAPSVMHLALITERELTQLEREQLDANRVDLFQWRKHADLNAWMEQLYRSKGGTEVFNCVPMPLDRADIQALDDMLATNNAYPDKGAGFFWGETQPEDIEDDKQFIRMAYNHLDEGWEIYYMCWW